MAENSKYNVKVQLTNKDGELQDFYFHPGLYAMIQTGYEFMKKKRHFFGLITGGVGDGKSNLAVSLGALWEHFNERDFSIDNNIVWTTKKFIDKTNDETNQTHCIMWDEAIQGASGKKMALTTEGDMLKIAIVTKRFKRHFYILLVDEIEEYSWKLIKMANFWVHLENSYGERGYFKTYVNKGKIKAIYQAFKFYKWDWSKITLKPDIKGRFYPYLPEIIDEDLYDKTKMQETQVIEEEKSGGKKISIQDLKRYNEIKEKRAKKMTWEQIGGEKERMWFSRTNKHLESI